MLGIPTTIACTPFGVIKMLESTGIDFTGKNAVVIGRSNIVGKPMAMLLLQMNCTVTICHSKTTNLKEVCKNADVLVAAIGRSKFVTADMVKDGAVIIDVGINRIESGLVGDVDFESVKEKASYITPVPGGVGPMTVAMLLENTYTCACLNSKGENDDLL
jgi:methylenetetrahydrofolate dehydrogenase (NADP+)/methenyltetrahydrofolate cyclohydrolase